MSAARGVTRRMDEVVGRVEASLGGLAGARVSTHLVDTVRVRAYGGEQQLQHVARIAVQQPRTLVVDVHDPGLVSAVERALHAANLGAAPQTDGATIRLTLPVPSEEQRERRARTAKSAAEAARVQIRNLRKDAVNELRRQRAADQISEAKLRGRSRDLQTAADERSAKVDAALRRALDELR